MKTSTVSRLAVFAAASLLAVSSAAYAADRGGKNGDRGDRRNRDNNNAEFIWKDHENGCAVGNKPPPGANCTNRDDAQ